MAEEPEIQNKVIVERVTTSGSSKQNLPVIIAVIVIVAVVLYFVLGRT